MKRRVFLQALVITTGAAGTVTALASCTGSASKEARTAQTPGASDGGSGAGATSARLPDNVRELLASHGITGTSIQEAVHAFDSLPQARPLEIMGSVGPAMISIGNKTTSFDLDTSREPFYLSLAPYRTRTHPCDYHALGGCQGELANTDIRVTITADDGEKLVDENTTTYANGFVGYWLPRDRQGTVTVTLGSKKATSTFDTSAQGRTCMTDLQLR